MCLKKQIRDHVCYSAFKDSRFENLRYSGQTRTKKSYSTELAIVLMNKVDINSNRKERFLRDESINAKVKYIRFPFCKLLRKIQKVFRATNELGI